MKKTTKNNFGKIQQKNKLIRTNKRFNYNLKLQTLLLIVFSSLISLKAISQNETTPSNSSLTLKPITEVKNHYKELQNYSINSDSSQSEIDAIEYPSKAYGWISFLLQPAYVKKKKLKEFYLELNLPANSSPQTKAELEFLLKLQQNRTKEEAKEILLINDIVYVPIFKANEDDLFYICSKVIGNQITGKVYPNTKKLLNNIMKESRIIEFKAKNHFMRARPWQLESRLIPLETIETPSFASGHTIWAYLQSYILAALIPEKRNEFIDLAYDIGYTREVMGVHYPSDEEAARQLAYKIVESAFLTKKFQKDFKLAQAEW